MNVESTRVAAECTFDSRESENKDRNNKDREARIIGERKEKSETATSAGRPIEDERITIRERERGRKERGEGKREAKTRRSSGRGSARNTVESWCIACDVLRF